MGGLGFVISVTRGPRRKGWLGLVVVRGGTGTGTVHRRRLWLVW